MLFELRSNEHLEVEIISENAIEHAFLETIGRQAAKGKTVTITPKETQSQVVGLVLLMEK